MEITNFRFKELTGRLDVDPESFYESRLSRPVDLYPEHRERTALEWWGGGTTEETAMDADEEGIEITQTFLFVETDAGVEGIAGPIGEEWAQMAAGFEDLLVGEDPRATERCWDLMYRDAVHGRKGKRMHAISAVDVALWDAKGKAAGEPVHRLLGGPVRTELPAYASMLAFSTDPEDAAETAAEYREKGYPAQKWFFRNGVGSGTEGKRDNADLVAAVREATGEDYDLFFDAWMSWNRAYALDMFERIAEHRPGWVEEPVQPDRIDGYAELRREADFPVAGGEHEYTRYGIHELLDREAVDVLQPDTMWAGGITELRHICSLASVRDIPVIPHGHLVPANAQVIAAHPETVCPLVEYLVRWNEKLQLFFDEPTKPEDGHVTVPDDPGIGVELDRDRAETVREPDY